MKSFLRNSYFILLLSVLVKSVVVAQVNSYPVNGIVKVALPASISFEDYVNPTTSPIDLVISLNDQRFPVRSVFVSLGMEGPAGTVVSFTNRVSYQLISGNNFIPKAVVAACFSPDNLSNLPRAYLDKAMPAGLYTFSFRVTDALTGAVLSLPISSAPVWIEASDSPVPVQPANYSALSASQVQNVIFQWLPRHTPNPNIEYEFTLTELPIANRGNLQNVFLSQPPLCKITTPIPTLQYDAKYPPLRQGYVYAWRVQAKPKFGIAPGKTSAFLNEGYSEIFSFLYEQANVKLNPPTDLQVAYSADYGSLNMNWKGEDNHYKYEISLGKEVDIYGDVNGYIAVTGKKYVEFDVIETEKGVENSTKLTYKHFGTSFLQQNIQITVRAIDKFGRVSDPVSYQLASIDKIAFNDVIDRVTTLKGTVEASMLEYKDNSGTLVVAGERGSVQIVPAAVYLYSSNNKIVEPHIDAIIDDWSRKIGDFKLYKAQVLADGTYSFDIRLHEVKQFKHQYILIKSPSSNFYDVISSLDIPQEGLTEKNLPVQKTVMKTMKLTTTFYFDEKIQFAKSNSNGSRVTPDGKRQVFVNGAWVDDTEDKIREKNIIDNDKFEELNLYRLKSVYDDPANNKFLKLEAGDYSSSEINYNNRKYVKIGKLSTNSVFNATASSKIYSEGTFFSSDFFSDNLVVEVKEFDKDAVFYPLPKFSHSSVVSTYNYGEPDYQGKGAPGTGLFHTIFDGQPNAYRRPSQQKVSNVENRVASTMRAMSPEFHRFQIKFTAPLVHIYGQVASRGNEQVIPAKNIEVGIAILRDETSTEIRKARLTNRLSSITDLDKIHWEEVQTDDEGKYDFTLPESISSDTTIQSIIIYNRIPGVLGNYQTTFIIKPSVNTAVDIEIPTAGAVIASVVKNQEGSPVAGAKLTHSSGVMATTNQNGEFVMYVSNSPALDADPTLKLMADGYEDEVITLANFQKTASAQASDDYGLSFWTAQIDELRKLTGEEFITLGNEDAFINNFRVYFRTLSTFYKRDSVQSIAIKHVVQLKTYVLNKDKQKQYVPSNVALFFDEKPLSIPKEGIVQLMHTNATSLVGEVTNPDSTAKTIYVEEKFTLGFDAPASKKDTIKIELMLREAVLVAGIVTGFSSDSTKVGPEEDVTISTEGAYDVVTDTEGRFRIWLEKDAEEVELTLKKRGFADNKVAFTTKIKTQQEIKEDLIKSGKNKSEGSEKFVYTTEEVLRNLNLEVYEIEITIPEFTTLQGFKVAIDKIKRVDESTFSISGSLDVSGENGMFELEEGEELSFKNIKVEIDENNDENAILVEDAVDLLQETINLKLFNYAKVESNNEDEGSLYPLQLVKLNLDGNESFGKIGGASLKFLPNKIMKKDAEEIFREFKLIPKVDDKKDVEYTEEDQEKAAKAKADKEARAKAQEKEEQIKAKRANGVKTAKARAKAAKNEKTQAKAKERAEKSKARYEKAAKSGQEKATKASEKATKANERATKAEARAKKANEKITESDEKLTKAEEKAKKAEEKLTKAKEAAAQARAKAANIKGNSAKAKAEAAKAKAAADKAAAAVKKAEVDATKTKDFVSKAKQTTEKAREDAEKAKGNAAQAQEKATQAQEKADQAKEKATQAEELAKNGPPVKKDTVKKSMVTGLIDKGKTFAKTKGKKIALTQGKKLLMDKLNPKASEEEETGESGGDNSSTDDEDGGDDEEADEDEEAESQQEARQWEYIIPVFVSGGKNLTTYHENLEYQLEYPKEVNGVPRDDQKDFRGKPTGKKEVMSIEVGAGFEVLIDEAQESILSKEGVLFPGNLGFPEMPKIGFEGKMPPIAKFMLAPKETLPLKELSFNKQPGKPYLMSLGMAKKWRLELDKIKLLDNFEGAEFGGRLYTDSLNHLIVHSMAVRKVNGTTYPYFDLEFPTEGLKIKDLVLKSPNNQHILAGYKEEDDAYEVDAVVRLEMKKPGELAKRLFPLEVEKFVYNTSGKFYLAVKLGKSFSIGPVKINVRKVIFNKGADISWQEMLSSLAKGTPNINSNKPPLKAGMDNYKTSNAKSAGIRRSRTGRKLMIEGQYAALEEEVFWAIGFAGGVEVEKLKGMTVKGDASFVFGERKNEGFNIQFNSLQVDIKSNAFHAYVKLLFLNNKDKWGFEGEGQVETAKLQLDASFKYYKYDGLKQGIEFGVSFKINAQIPIGPITFTKVGGGIDINTVTNRYSVFFLGDAKQTSLPEDVVRYPNIKIEVLFELDECGVLPVIKGTADVYLKNKYACNGLIIIDLCRISLLLNVECSIDLAPSMHMDARATLYVTTNNFFLGAAANLNILGIKVNAVVAIGYRAKITAGEGVPSQVAHYGDLIEKIFLTKDGELTGIYIDAVVDFKWKGDGKVFVILSWDAKLLLYNRTTIFVAFDRFEFYFRNDFKFEFGASLTVAGIGPFVELSLAAMLKGGYNATDDWFFEGSLDATIAFGWDRSADCNFGNAIIFKKVCIGAGVTLGYKRGFSFKLGKE